MVLVLSLVRNRVALVIALVAYFSFGEHSGTYLAEAVAQSVVDRVATAVAEGAHCYQTSEQQVEQREGLDRLVSWFASKAPLQAKVLQGMRDMNWTDQAKATFVQCLRTEPTFTPIVERFLQTLVPQVSARFKEPLAVLSKLWLSWWSRAKGFSVGCGHLTSQGLMIPVRVFTGPKNELGALTKKERFQVLVAGGGRVHMYEFEVLRLPKPAQFRGLTDAVAFAAHEKDATVSTGVSHLVKPQQTVGLASKIVSAQARIEVVTEDTVLFSHGEPTASLEGNSGASGMLMSESGSKSGEASEVAAATVHIGVSGDRGLGGTLKNGTAAHLLMSEGKAVSCSSSWGTSPTHGSASAACSVGHCTLAASSGGGPPGLEESLECIGSAGHTSP